MSAKSDRWVSILLELDEMGITNEQILKACRIKDTDTIAGWYRGTTPRPKNRSLLIRFLGKMKALRGQNEPTDEHVHESLLNPYDGSELTPIPDVENTTVGSCLVFWNHVRNWRENMDEFRERFQRNQGRPVEEWEKPNHPRNSSRLHNDVDFRISIVVRFHPSEFVRIHFQSL